MKTYKLNLHGGEIAPLRQLDNGSFACPICGEEWERFPPYVPNDGTVGPVHEFSAPMLGEVCPGCDVEFGVEDGGSAEAWRYHRVKWLDRHRWSADALNRLRANLGLTEENLRIEALRVREAEDRGHCRSG
jgi:hypothetical protein